MRKNITKIVLPILILVILAAIVFEIIIIKNIINKTDGGKTPDPVNPSEYVSETYDFGGNETVTQYRIETEKRINEIRSTTSEIVPEKGGTAYYVSNNGSSSNDGLSKKTPLATLKDVNKLKLRSGDVVYFECGGVWRGQLKSTVKGVTYTSYGKGDKPKFYASPENGSGSENWEKVADNIYVCKIKSISGDVGSIIFNEGEYWGIKKIPVEVNGNMVDNATGEVFSGYEDLKSNFDFYHDLNHGGKLYLYYDGGNPGDVFDSIEFNVHSDVILTTADNVTFDNLCVKYCGGIGIAKDTNSIGLHITNCEFGWIGGSIMIAGKPTRFGNAIQIWGSALDFIVDNCYFYQIYDAGVTWQYSSSAPIGKIADGVTISNNVMDYCTYSIEYFFSEGDINECYMKNIEFSNNSMWFAGDGLGAQRPKSSAAHIKSWTHANNIASNGYFNITNNIFAFSRENLLETYSVTGIRPKYSDNVYIQYKGGLLGFTGGLDGGMVFSEANVTDIFKDATGEVIIIEE